MPRGRQPGFRMSDEHRVKIQNSNILNALLKHVDGKQDMSTTQVTAGLGLLKKVLPDLQAMTIGGDEENPLAFKDVTQEKRLDAFMAFLERTKK
jgi:hypothetical protein